MVWAHRWKQSGSRVASLAVALGAAFLLTACAGGQVSQPQTLEAMIAAGNGPTLDMLKKPGPLGDRAMGDPDAPVTVIEYASLTCPYCRRFHADVFPRFKRKYIDTGKVHFIYREFPIGRSAGTAAVAARCVPETALLRGQLEICSRTSASGCRKTCGRTRSIKLCKSSISNARTLTAVIENHTIVEGLKQVKARGRDLGVSATPTIFVNTEMRRGGVSYEDLVKLIDTSQRNRAAGLSPLVVASLSC